MEYIPYLVGKKGVTIKRLQRDFDCLVTVPRSGRGGLVKIKAFNQRSLIESKNRIGDLVSSARKKSSKHKIILELKLSSNTIQACRDMGNQFVHVTKGTIQFVNPAVYEIVLAATSLSDLEVVVAKEVLAKYRRSCRRTCSSQRCAARTRTRCRRIVVSFYRICLGVKSRCQGHGLARQPAEFSRCFNRQVMLTTQHG